MTQTTIEIIEGDEGTRLRMPDGSEVDVPSDKRPEEHAIDILVQKFQRLTFDGLVSDMVDSEEIRESIEFEED